MKLPNVTLVCVSTIKHISSAKALLKSCEQIEFGEVLFFTNVDLENDKFKTIQISAINSKEEYSKWVILNLAEYINTDFILIVQYDGYVIHPELWNNAFLNYDYIGSPWWYETNNVGNGGFSLRSKRLMQTVSKIFKDDFHPEDDRICRTHRKTLEDFYQIKFAPEGIAAKFSFEPNHKYNTYNNDTFGFHGISQYIL